MRIACFKMFWRLLYDGGNMQCAQFFKQQKQAYSHGGITDTRNIKSLICSITIGRGFVPEPNKQVAAQANAFPSQV